MKILSFGSLNIDYVYRLPHIVVPRETISSNNINIFAGGKGLNQSAAAIAALQHTPGQKTATVRHATTAPNAHGAHTARTPQEKTATSRHVTHTVPTAHATRTTPTALAATGATDIKVLHAGCVGNDDRMLCAELQKRGVDTTFVRTVETPTGHAIIQVAESGENAIIVYGGANRDICPAHITEAIDTCAAGDILLLQNEINAIPEIMTAASQRKIRIFFNAAPCSAQVAQYPLHLADTLIVNEVEGEMLSGKSDPQHIIAVLTARYPHSAIIVTAGAKGALYGCGTTRHHAAAPSFKVVDTTGAGDTFVGYYAASIASASTPADAMHIACHAASLSITRQGATASIPYYWEVAPHIQNQE